MRQTLGLQVRLGLAGVLLLIGCTQEPTGGLNSSVARGRVHGGQQPVTGATVQLYEAGTTDGGPSIPLLTTTVKTDANGEFSITGDYTCPAPTTLVYVIASGGNPGLAPGTNNNALALMGAIGECGNLTSSTILNIDELTTVAAVWALAPFMNSYSAIGSSAANAASLAGGFRLAAEFANLATGMVPGANVPAGVTVPTEQINTIADILAVCINSAGGVAGDGSACGNLFAYSTPPTGAAPRDVIGAGLNIANHPELNVPNLFSLAAPVAPYQPELGAAPADYRVRVVTTSGTEADQATPFPVAGATSDYHFQDGSGSTLSDFSGNGNAAMLGGGSAAPVWTDGGLAFTYLDSVSLPAALNNSKTFCNWLYMMPLSFAAPTNVYPVLVSSSLGTAGLNLMYAYNGYNNYAAFAPFITANNSTGLASADLMSGYHAVCFTLGGGGGDLNQAYVDGVEVSYTAQGSSYGAQSSGNLFLGASGISPFVNSGLNGTYYRFATWPTKLTAMQVEAVSAAGTAEIAARGIPTAPVMLQQTAPQLIAGIESIAAGQGLSNPSTQNWSANLTLTNQPNYEITDYGISGMTLQAVSGSEMNRGALLCNYPGSPPVYIFYGGGNDAGVLPGATLASVWNSAASIIRTMKTAGCKVYIGTTLSHIGTASGYGGTFDAWKNGFDSIILSSAAQAGADGVIDFAANPLLGADGAYANPDLTICPGGAFLADGMHPSACGQLLMATAASNKLNYDNGYNVGNPHVVSATTYQMTAGDGAIVAAPAGNAAYTMPDCTGQVGAIYTINNPQSTYTVTVVGGTNQPINGSTAPIPIASNSRVAFADVSNDKTISGCHWAM